MVQPSDITCVILAAGVSSRFGSSKMLHKLDSGICILAKTIRLYRQVFTHVNVVVREADLAIMQLVENEGAAHIINSNADMGLSQSIIAGVKSTAPSKAWLFALGDMPYVSVNTLESITKKVSADTIVVPRTCIGNGNPIALGTRFKSELIDLNGDIGAKPVVKRYADSVNFHDCDDRGIHQDIDQLSDILKF